MAREGWNSSASLFARPLNAPRVLEADRDAPVWPRQAGWMLGAVAFGLLLGLSLPNNAQNAPAGRADTTGGARTPANARPAAQSTAPTATAVTARPGLAVPDSQDDAPTESRRPVSFYTQTVRGTMFSAPLLPAPKAPVVVAAPTSVVKPPPAPPVGPAVFNPLSFWSYTGTITMGDQVMALLENSQSKEGQYVKAGDRFMGAEVVSVSDQMVTLRSGGKPTMLAKSDNITVTPLDRSAAPTSAQQPAQPQGQGQITVSIGGQTLSLGAPVQQQQQQRSVTLPNGIQITPQQAQRRNRRLNNNFNQ